jgi:hypothetical protein
MNRFQEFIGNSLSKAAKLQAVHVNFFSAGTDGTEFFHVSPRDALQIVKQCSPTLTQIGFASRVWQVRPALDLLAGESDGRLGREGGHPSGRRQDDDC